MQQITLNLEPGITDAYPTCREFLAFRTHQQGRPMKAIAADLDMSPSDLSRKLAQSPDDSRRFTLDDLERWIEVNNDTSPILYLVEKYMVDAQAAELEQLRARLARLEGNTLKRA